jgi:hypothetical protein
MYVVPAQGQAAAIVQSARHEGFSYPVTAEFWISQAFNGLSYGALLFLLASGLSLIFGVMRVVNLAPRLLLHAGRLRRALGRLAHGQLPGSPRLRRARAALIGAGMQRFFLRRPARPDPRSGPDDHRFALIFQDLALLIWGGDPYTIPVPPALQGVISVGALRFPRYRIFIVVVAVVVGALLWLALDPYADGRHHPRGRRRRRDGGRRGHPRPLASRSRCSRWAPRSPRSAG